MRFVSDVRSLKSVALIGLVLLTDPAFGARRRRGGPPHPSVYTRQAVREARFGSEELQRLRGTAQEIEYDLLRNIVAQPAMSKSAGTRIRAYLDGFGRHQGEPSSQHVIGFPGIGKNLLVNLLKEYIPTLTIDVQKFVGGKSSETFGELFRLIERFVDSLPDKNTPWILHFDEPDKAPELAPDGTEITQPVIGIFNEILSSGHLVGPYGRNLDFTNVFLLSTMNFSPKTMERFVRLVVKRKDATFYNLTEAEMAKINDFLLKQDTRAEVASMLGELFRTNTVSRILPEIVIGRILLSEDLRKLSDLNFRKVVQRYGEQTRIKVTTSEAFLDFLNRETAYLPAGARTTIRQGTHLTSQLMHFVARQPLAEGDAETVKNDPTLSKPRQGHFHYNPKKQEAVVTITEVVRRGNRMEPGKSKIFRIPYVRDSLTFDIPPTLAVEMPDAEENARLASSRPPSKALIATKRFAKQLGYNRQFLRKKVDEQIVGYEEIKDPLLDAFSQYFVAEAEELPWPNYRTLASFPGNGKTKLIELLAEITDMPVIKLNMQQYAGGGADAAKRLVRDLAASLAAVPEHDGRRRYLFLVEDPDKCPELNPINGLPETANWAAMALLKDLLSSGFHEANIDDGIFGQQIVRLDVSDAFMVINMNFGIDIMNFHNDPRVTTVEDTVEAWKNLNTSIQSMRKLLQRLFLPETVDRFLTQPFNLVQPLNEEQHAELVELAMHERIQTLMTNGHAIEIWTTGGYREFLYRESVIPAQGGRATATGAAQLVDSHLQKAVEALMDYPELRMIPVKLRLDFKP
ncbi:hypothetical protein K2X33_05615, partial [bacterium]|nr:hypothetical protein [bacterium]